MKDQPNPALAPAPGSARWTISTIVWQPKQGHTSNGMPKLTVLQSVCALGICIKNQNDEDALNHCAEIIKQIWLRRGKSPNDQAEPRGTTNL